MPRGHEDYGVQLQGLKPSLDLGELAARLLKGAGANYRGGNVIYFSVMQNGLAEFPLKTLAASPSAIKLNASYADYGAACLELVTDNLANAETILGKDFPINYTGKIGFETSVLWRTAAALRYHMRLVTYFASGRVNTYKVRINSDANGTLLDLDYWNSAGAYADQQSLGLITLSRGFQSFKLVVNNSDETAPMYDKFICNGVEIDMSTIAAQTSTSSNAYIPVTRTEIGHEALAATSRSLYVGLYTFTINET